MIYRGVKFLRQHYGLSQKEMGILMGIKGCRVGAIERGRPLKQHELSSLKKEFGEDVIENMNVVIDYVDSMVHIRRELE
jgi:transcriptional regulator with XRE-family HTH domain